MCWDQAVGGVGLNLTGADVVVFFENDWNPATDLQAMDRAHRIGQQRSVNVYRLLCQGTVEEEVLSVQRMKQYLANTVVGADNASMRTMETDSVLDRLESAHTSTQKQ